MILAQAVTQAEATVPAPLLKLFGAVSTEALLVTVVGIAIAAAIARWPFLRIALPKAPEPASTPVPVPVQAVAPVPCGPAIAALADVAPRRARYTLDTPTRDITRDAAEAKAILAAKDAWKAECEDVLVRLTGPAPAVVEVEAAPKPARGRKAT